MNNGILIKANSRRVLTRLASRKKKGKKLYFELKWLLLSKITRLHEEAPVESIKGVLHFQNMEKSSPSAKNNRRAGLLL